MCAVLLKFTTEFLAVFLTTGTHDAWSLLLPNNTLENFDPDEVRLAVLTWGMNVNGWCSRSVALVVQFRWKLAQRAIEKLQLLYKALEHIDSFVAKGLLKISKSRNWCGPNGMEVLRLLKQTLGGEHNPTCLFLLNNLVHQIRRWDREVWFNCYKPSCLFWSTYVITI